MLRSITAMGLGFILTAWGISPVWAQANNLLDRTRTMQQGSSQNLNQQVQQTTGDSVNFVGGTPPVAPIPVSVPSVEFRPGGSAGAPTATGASPYSPQALAEFHIRQNVCNGQWSALEMSEMFPQIDANLVKKTCRS